LDAAKDLLFEATTRGCGTDGGYACALLRRRRPRMPNPASAVPNNSAAGGSGTGLGIMANTFKLPE